MQRVTFVRYVTREGNMTASVSIRVGEIFEDEDGLWKARLIVGDRPGGTITLPEHLVRSAMENAAE
ncbi:hypothetical protein PBI_LICORICE_1 [Mycobacterium phage Licorice]|nr:hypothetical protein PBI_LICORICE_1 [Mycobacterium phage Licorice]